MPAGERASLRRCQAILEKWGVEGIKTDPHEHPCMLMADEVEGLCYTQHGFFTPRAGAPDFLFIDTMWEKMK